MPWSYIGPSEDFSGPATYEMQDGWFWDDKRNPKDGSSYYLFSADGTTSFGPGTPGYTVASNLPELLFTTPDGDPSYDTSGRVNSQGDSTRFEIKQDAIRITNLPAHPITSRAAKDQTVNDVEAIYWEGSIYDDNITLQISTEDPIVRSFFYVGGYGSDTLNISGFFEQLDGTYQGSFELVDVFNSFVGDGDDPSRPDYDSSVTPHSSYTDTLFIDDYSINGYSIVYQELDYSLFGNATPTDTSTLFRIQKESAVYYGVDVEIVKFKDSEFTRDSIRLASSEDGEILLGSNSNDYLGGYSGQDELNGGGGDDFLNGLDGSDTLYGGDGDDTVNGGDGDDLIIGGDGRGDDYYEGGSGIDSIKYTSSINNPVVINLRTGLVKGLEVGNDTLVDIENIIAGQSNDTITGGAGSNLIDGYSGIDTVVFQGKYSEYGFIADKSGDLFVTDRIRNRDGEDTLRNVEILSFADKSLKVSEVILDVSRPSTPADPDAGLEELNAGPDQSEINNTQTESVVVSPLPDQPSENNTDSSKSSSPNGEEHESSSVNSYPIDTIDPDPEPMALTSILELEYSEEISRINLSDPFMIEAGQISTLISGTAVSDLILGSDNNEGLFGGIGRDSLTGNAGADGFGFDSATEFGKNYRDVVTDFDSSEGDKIILVRTAFAGVDNVRLRSVSGKKNARQASSSSKKFVYDDRRGILYFNENGKKNGWGDGGEFVKLLGAPEIGKADFAIV